MIARTWDGLVDAARGDEYVDYVKRTGLADLKATEGNRGVYVLRRDEGDRARIRVISLWDSPEAIRRFAGDPMERARYYPEDAQFLVALEPTVDHFDVAAEARASGREAEVAALADALRRVGQGDAWHGPALAELLDGLAAERAAARPLALVHSIWEIVLHVAAWTGVFRGRIEGKAAEEPEEGDFPPVADPTPENWMAARARLRQAHTRLVATVAALEPEALEARVPGRPFSVRFQIHSALRHVVYHSGQIGLLKTAVGG